MTSADGEPGESLTAEQIQQLLQGLFRRAHGLAHAADAGTIFVPIQPGSALASVDAETKPYQLSHTAQGLIVSSVEHLQAIIDLAQHVPIHGKPLFTLARTAVEAAATAHWITVEQPHDQMLSAFSIFEEQDSRDSAAVLRIVAKQASSDISSEVDARAKHVRDLAVAYPTANGNRRFRTTGVLQTFDQRVATSVHPTRFETFWRAASGLAHARPWAARTLLIAETTSLIQSEEEVVAVKFVIRDDRLAWLLSMAIESIELAIGAYNAAAQGVGVTE